MIVYFNERGAVTETSFDDKFETHPATPIASIKGQVEDALDMPGLHWIEEIPGKRWRGYTYPPGKLVTPGITCSVALIIAEE